MRTFVLATVALLAAVPAAAQQPDPWQAKAREILARSVAFKSSAKMKETPGLAAYLADEFRKAGVPAAQITTVPVGETVALVVRIPGRDRARKPILFSAHMDVVEADPKDWQRDPFTLTTDGPFFYGRGSSDDKTGVAHLSTLIIRMAKESLTPSRDLVFAFIGDEETAMRTTRALANERKALIDAEYALNADAGGGVLDEATGRPILYTIQGGEKTYSDFTLTVTNPGGHSSQPRADNAITRLAAALEKIAAYRFPVRSNALTQSSMAAQGRNTPGELGEAMRRFAADPVAGPAAERLRREPSMVGQTGTTCVATLLSGGHATNALPQRATANINCRIWPGEGIEATRATLERVVSDPEVKVTSNPAGAIESPASTPRPDVTAAVTKAVQAGWGPVPVAYEQSSGATDGSHYRAAGIPTFGVTLMFIKASDEFAHGLNERVLIESFDKATTGWWSVVRDLADPR